MIVAYSSLWNSGFCETTEGYYRNRSIIDLRILMQHDSVLERLQNSSSLSTDLAEERVQAKARSPVNAQTKLFLFAGGKFSQIRFKRDSFKLLYALFTNSISPPPCPSLSFSCLNCVMSFSCPNCVIFYSSLS